MNLNVTNAQDQEILRVFGGTTYQPNAMDVITGKLWDCCTFDPGESTSQHRYFTIPRGQYTISRTPHLKTLKDTNLQIPSQLFAPEAFAVQRILFVFSADADPIDVYGVAESLVFQFYLGDKWYATAPLIALQTSRTAIAPIHICTYCHAVYVVAHQCPGCGAREFRLSGMQEQTGLQFFFEPLHAIVINNQASFHLQFEGDWIARQPFSLWVYLEGLHARGVQ